MKIFLNTLKCLVNGDPASKSFSLDPLSSAPPEELKTVGDLRAIIHTSSPSWFRHVEAEDLALWHVSVLITPDQQNLEISLENVQLPTKLVPTQKLSDIFPEMPPHNTIHIIVQRPLPGFTSKRSRLITSPLMEAISAAGLTDQAVVKGTPFISRLDNNERVSVLGFLGQIADGDDDFTQLAQTAFNLRNAKADIKTLDKLSAPEKNLPVVRTRDLYIRKTYAELYTTILEGFKRGDDKRIVITGTAGIGKSVFLIYLAIRLLAESGHDNPSIVIYHTNDSKKCFAFGGCSIIRCGSIDEFRSFLNVPETWYLVDSSLDPKIDNTYARTVITASPKTLFSNKQHYRSVVKTVELHYFMAPWDREELMQCRNCVSAFNTVPLSMVEELYLKIGGVPRYVLRTPNKSSDHDDNEVNAVEVSCEHLVQALQELQGAWMLAQLFPEKRDSLEFNSCLVHHWPVGDHRTFRLEWASPHVASEIAKLMGPSICTKVLRMIRNDLSRSLSDITFE